MRDVDLPAEASDHLARIPHSKHIIGYVTVDNAASPNDGARTNTHTGEDDSPASDPYIRANGNRLTRLPLSPKLSAKGMRCCVDLDCRAKEGIVTDDDWTNVQDDTVEVEVYMFTQLDIESVIAIERWLDPNGVTTSGEKLSEGLTARCLC